MALVRRIILALVVLFVLIQLAPYGRNHANPPVKAEPPWDAPRTRELFFRACADCHSNQTVWPWYSHVAPVSWLVYKDVASARRHFNVSEWGRPRNSGDEAAYEVQQGFMPLDPYVKLHPSANLNAAEKAELVRGLRATFPHGAEEDSTEAGPDGDEAGEGH